MDINVFGNNSGKIWLVEPILASFCIMNAKAWELNNKTMFLKVNVFVNNSRQQTGSLS